MFESSVVKGDIISLEKIETALKIEPVVQKRVVVVVFFAVRPIIEKGLWGSYGFDENKAVGKKGQGHFLVRRPKAILF